jgi:hypothetical protein
MPSCSHVCTLLNSCDSEFQGIEYIVAFRPVAG